MSNKSITNTNSKESTEQTDGQLPNIQENSTQILNDIQYLQSIEQQLFNSLEENTGLTTDQQKKIIEKINGISKMRINLYKTLDGINSFFQSSLANSKGTLTEQTAAIDIVEKELNDSKQRLKILEEEKNNKIRLVEINNYYGEKYAEHSGLMKIIVYMLVPILILTIIFNKGIIPATIYYILIAIIALIGAIFIWRTVFSIVLRDSMNYQAYDWYFDPSTAPTSTTVDSEDPWKVKSASNFGSCVGDACCSDDLVYDSSSNQCVISTTTTDTTTETFVNNIFTKSANNYKKPDVTLGGNDIQSNNSKSFINNSKF